MTFFLGYLFADVIFIFSKFVVNIILRLTSFAFQFPLKLLELPFHYCRHMYGKRGLSLHGGGGEMGIGLKWKGQVDNCPPTESFSFFWL